MQDEISSAQDPQALLLEDRNITDFLHHLTVLGEQLFSTETPVPCGVMSRRGRRHLNVKSSSRVAAALDELHHDVGEGPSLAAMTSGEVVVVDDTRDDQRWVRYFSSSAATEYASMLSVPLELGTEGIGTLNFYAHPAGYFTTDRQHTAGIFAAQAGKALEMAMRVARHQDATSDMYAAMEERTSIDMAVGIIIGQNNCTQREAFEILKRASSTRNQKLRHVARDVVIRATGTTRTPTSPPDTHLAAPQHS